MKRCGCRCYFNFRHSSRRAHGRRAFPLASVALLLVVLLAHLRAQEPSRATSEGRGTRPLVIAFLKTVGQISDVGGDVWDRLATDQARRSLAQIATAAAALEAAKDDFRKDALAPSTTPYRVATIQMLAMRVGGPAGTLYNTLRSYAAEVSEASPLIGNELAVAAGRANFSAPETKELIALANEWRPEDTNNRERALRHLNAAISDLDRMRAGVKCLQDTLSTRRKACQVEGLVVTHFAHSTSSPGSGAPQSSRADANAGEGTLELLKRAAVTLQGPDDSTDVVENMKRLTALYDRVLSEQDAILALARQLRNRDPRIRVLAAAALVYVRGAVANNFSDYKKKLSTYDSQCNEEYWSAVRSLKNDTNPNLLWRADTLLAGHQ